MSTNIPVREMDLATHHNVDGRRVEVVADGLALWHGAQLAIDTTLVSPLRRDGSARFRAADHDGAVLMEARRRKEEPIPNCLEREGGLDWWSSLRKWVAGGVKKRQSSWLRWPMPRHKLPFSFCRTVSKLPTFAGGVQCSHVRRPERSQLPCWTSATWLVGVETRLQCMRLCVTTALSGGAR